MFTPCSCLDNTGAGGGSGTAGGFGSAGGFANAGGSGSTAGGTATGSDVTAPRLESLSFTPASADTTNASQTLTFTATITDDLSGFSSLQFELESPSGNQSRTAFATSSSRTSGTAQNGAYSFTVTMPQYSEAGTWKLGTFYLRDVIGNSRSLVTADLAGAGAQTTFAVTSNPDTTPPRLTALGVSPSSVNTSSASATLTFTATLTDDLSGVASLQFELESPSGNQSRTAFATSSSRTSGTAQNGTYGFTVTMPQFSEPGTWTIGTAYLRDAIGNSRSLVTADLTAIGAPTTVNVTGSADTTPPRLTSLTFTPGIVNASSATVTMSFTATLTDDLSGVSSLQFELESPSGSQSRTAFATSSNRVSGTAQSGTYSFAVIMPQFSETGTWRLGTAYLRDAVGNSRQVLTADLMAIAAPTTFLVQ